jgi:hypothetical protein
MSEISIGNLRAIAYHLEQGQDNGGLLKEALALQLRSVADELEKFYTFFEEVKHPKNDLLLDYSGRLVNSVAVIE